MEEVILKEKKEEIKEEKKKILELKEEIKKLSKEQRYLKSQRKTVNLKGERTINPMDAQFKVQMNKYNLRHLYLVYAKLRGKDIKIVERSYKNPPNTYTLEKLIQKYS
jgi:hypothetical protein